MMALVSPRIDPSSEFAQLKRSSDEVDYTYSREKRKKKLRVDLNKLNASTSEIIENAEILLLADGFANLKTGLKSSSLRQRFSFENKLESSPVNINRLKKETGMTLVPVEREAEVKDKTKLGKYYTQYKFLGALNSEQQDEHLTNRTRMKEDEDVYKIPFRLSVTAPPILRRDLLEELFIETVQGASDIRNSIREAERYLANLPPKVVKKKPGTTIDQRMFIRTHGTMSLGTFRAVEQAYKDRDRAEALASKMSKVRHLKKKREHSIERTKSYKMKYSQIISRRKTDGKEIVSDAIAENKRQDKSLYENLQATRMATKQYKHKINTDRRFALDFIAQNNAVSKALAVHARTIQNENRIKEKAENVESWRAREGQQRETIQRFQKHQQLMRQAEATLTRANLEGVVLNDRNARQSKLRDRVEELKERKVTTHMGDKLASVTLAPPSLPPLAVIAPDQIETWENLPRKELKPRVHDRDVPWL